MNQKAKPAAPKLVKFRTTGTAGSIDPVELLRETAAFVYVANKSNIAGAKAERREAKVSSYDRYHDTWAAAHRYLLAKAEGEVRAARTELARVSGYLGNIKGMKPPKDGA